MNESGPAPAGPKGRIRQYFLIAAGFLGLALGVLGIFLPLLPTTPFILLAAACFFRSSHRLYAWLLRQKFLGRRIRCYRVYKAISLRSKMISLALLWLTIGYSAFFVARAVWLKIVLFSIAAAVSLHLLRFRTLTREMMAQLEDDAAAPGAPAGEAAEQGQISTSR